MSASEDAIWLVRHGETEWSADDLHTGRRDLPLTDEGRDQARTLRAALAARRFATVMVSPQQRARETCELAGVGDGAAVNDDLVEWDYGDYEGISDDDVRRDRPEWSLFCHGAPGGESPDDVVARADRVLAGLRQAPGPRAVFSHGKTLRVMAVRWLGQDASFGEALPLDAGAIGILDLDSGNHVLRVWNFAVADWAVIDR